MEAGETLCSWSRDTNVHGRMLLTRVRGGNNRQIHTKTHDPVIEGVKYWLIHATSWMNLENMLRASSQSQRPHTDWFSFHEMSRMSKPSGAEGERTGSDYLMSVRFLSGGLKWPRVRYCWWLRNFLNVLKAPELYSLMAKWANVMWILPPFFFF